MSRPIWFVNIIKHYFPDRFAIADLTRKSEFFKKIIDYLLFDGDEIYYLPKDSVVESYLNISASFFGFDGINLSDDNQEKNPVLDITGISIDIDTKQKKAIHEVVVVGETIDGFVDTVLPSEVVKHFINKANYHWIMYQCICRDSNHCKDYPIDLGCIFLGEAVKGINPKLGRLATREEALFHLNRASELGLVNMIGRNKIDTQWMGIGPGFKLMSICNCCPCCCLYKVLPNLHPTIQSKVTKMPGVEIEYTPDLCVACGLCLDVCITDNLALNEKTGSIEMGDHCLGCGRCVEVCKTQALQLKIQETDYIQETIGRLSKVVDVT